MPVSCAWTWRLLPALAAVVAPAWFFQAALPTAAQPQAQASLKGQFLIASPSMLDPRFDRAVILMVKHDQEGAFGIVINRPLDERPLADILKSVGEAGPTTTAKVRIFLGGPVQPELGFVIHSAEYHGPATINIDGRVAMTSSRDILRDIGDGKGPSKTLIAFGYAGWAPGQLEGELARRVWSTAPAEMKLIFDEDREKVWELATSHRTQDL